MQIFPNICRLYAGGGLMPDSEEESEWTETTAKMQSMLQLIQ
jgi:isochorismate synthase